MKSNTGSRARTITTGTVWRAVCSLAITSAFVCSGSADAQSGKWIGTISQLSGVSGSADLSIEPKNDKQAKAKISFRNGKRDTRLAWDIVIGRCREDGPPIAPQATFTQAQTTMDGSGTSTATVPKLESGKLYYFRVFDPQSPATDGTAWGCGNISEKP